MKIRNKIFYILFWLYACFLCVLMVLNGWYNDLGSDSAVQIHYCSQSFSVMWDWICRDFHPPLYHIMLWLVCHILPSIDQVYSLFSTIPFILVTIVAGTFMYKKFGVVSAWLTLTFWALMTQSTYHLVEARMYGWGAFFLFASFICFYQILSEKGKKWWVLFGVFTLAGMYTHYYVLIEMFFVMAYLLFHTLVFRRDLIKKTLILSLTLIIGYIPWLFILIKQSSVVSGGAYWIQEILSPRTCVWYLFSFADGYQLLFVFIGILFINIIVAKKIFEIKKENGKRHLSVSIKNVLKRPENNSLMLIQVSTICGIATIATGLILSHLMHPMILDRYIYFPAVGLWLAISITISKIPNKWVSYIACAAFIVWIGYYNLPIKIDAIQTEKESHEFKKQLFEIIPNEDDEKIIVTNEIMEYYPLSSYYYSNKRVELIDASSISEFLQEVLGEDVYYFATEEIKSNPGEEEINYEKMCEGTIGERYVYVYKLGW